MILVPPTNPVLWTRAEPVTDIATQVVPFWSAMYTLMCAHDGLGLAAPQVGINRAFFVTGILGMRVVINPRILASGCSSTAEEGCLSLPGYRREVERPWKVCASWMDLDGIAHTAEWLSGVEARVFQHETDHCFGRCIFERPVSVGHREASGAEQ